jgi:ribose transport system substrate-binding protein
LYPRQEYPPGQTGLVPNALDRAWRYAKEASSEDEATWCSSQVRKTNANNSDQQQVQDVENLINDRPDVLLVASHAEGKAILNVRQVCTHSGADCRGPRDVNEGMVTPGQDFATFVGSDSQKQVSWLPVSWLKHCGNIGSACC